MAKNNVRDSKTLIRSYFFLIENKQIKKIWHEVISLLRDPNLSYNLEIMDLPGHFVLHDFTPSWRHDRCNLIPKKKYVSVSIQSSLSNKKAQDGTKGTLRSHCIGQSSDGSISWKAVLKIERHSDASKIILSRFLEFFLDSVSTKRSG